MHPKFGFKWVFTRLESGALPAQLSGAVGGGDRGVPAHSLSGVPALLFWEEQGKRRSCSKLGEEVQSAPVFHGIME